MSPSTASILTVLEGREKGMFGWGRGREGGVDWDVPT